MGSETKFQVGEFYRTRGGSKVFIVGRLFYTLSLNQGLVLGQIVEGEDFGTLLTYLDDGRVDANLKTELDLIPTSIPLVAKVSIGEANGKANKYPKNQG